MEITFWTNSQDLIANNAALSWRSSLVDYAATVLVLGGIFVLLETFILVEYVVDPTSTLSSPNSQDSTTFKPHLVPIAKKIAAKKKKREQAGKQAKVAAKRKKYL